MLVVIALVLPSGLYLLHLFQTALFYFVGVLFGLIATVSSILRLQTTLERCFNSSKAAYNF